MRRHGVVVWCALICAVAACSRQDAGWRAARGEDSVAAYETYLERFPAGARADEARARIRALREEREWARADQLGTPEAFQRYLGAYPEGRFATAARDRLSDFVLARAPSLEPGAAAAAPGYELQLGAYSSAAAARQDLARLRRDHAELLGALQLRILPPAAQTPRLWRLRSPALEETAARGWCAKLAARGVDCVLVTR